MRAPPAPVGALVMSSTGPVNRLGDASVRPQDIEILSEDDGTGIEALLERVVHVGSDVRVELKLHDGREIWAQMPREIAEQRELSEGQIRSVRLPEPRVSAH